jgi:hypothetical protein
LVRGILVQPCHIITMLTWMLMVATLGVAMVPADARLAAGLVDHDKLRRFVPTSLG